VVRNDDALKVVPRVPASTDRTDQDTTGIEQHSTNAPSTRPMREHYAIDISQTA
jgi:hypothetical protein